MLCEYVDWYGILLIVDEVMSGFGCIGKWFVIEYYNVVLDIIIMVKGLMCGYVLFGVVVVCKPIVDYFENHFFVCGLIYSGHFVGCVVVLVII